MRSFTAPETTYLQSRNGYEMRALLWVQPRDTATGLRVGLGFTTGEQNEDYTISGSARTYVGGGAMAGLDPIVMQSGLTVRMQRARLQPLFPTVVQLLRGLDAWRAPAELHRAMINPETGALIAAPHRLWKGVIDAAPIMTPEIGGDGTVDLTLASASEALTHGQTLTRSDASQTLRGGDRFFRYIAVTGKVPVFWGSVRA
jgi:hypothetical protein